MGKMKDKLLEAHSEGYDEGYKNGFSSAVEEMIWECGDCGNRYDSLVLSCVNTLIHKANLGNHNNDRE
jgi:hypothetical protein